MLNTADEALALAPLAGGDDAAVKAKHDDWARTMAFWESEPTTGEGRRELAAKAKASEVWRDLSLERYHHFELASAAFQVGIVLAFAQVIIGIVALAFAGGLLGATGLALAAFGQFAPHTLPFLH